MNSWMTLSNKLLQPARETTIFSINDSACLTFSYTSLQAYRLLLENFPMPSLSLLNKIQQGSVDALKALKTLYEKGSFSRNCILMIISIRRECRSRREKKFVQRNCCVYGSWIKTVYIFRCSSYSRNHI